MSLPKGIREISEAVWEIPPAYKPGMLVPARVYASERLLREMEPSVFDQLTNVATLPGIVSGALCMPDGHPGYGFPIGGVAAMDPGTGVISPGGIGFDINCGMRLLLTNLVEEQVRPRLPELVDALFAQVPAGVGGRGFIRPTPARFRRIVERGAAWCVGEGCGWPEDLERTEEGGCAAGADASAVSDRAVARGCEQLGTLGSGNHYLEIQVARPENILDPGLAAAFGLTLPGQVVVMFHCGSRGFGHQVASDYLASFLKVMGPRYGIAVPDRELACAPFGSPEGQEYFAAMKCAINMAYVNRQVIAHRIREVFSSVFRKGAQQLGMHQLCDVAHNTARLERHLVDGEVRELLVHRKGATRAFGPGREELPGAFRATGQPLVIGGSMETGSYLLAGAAGGRETFCSTAHGSGRAMSRHEAKRRFSGRDLLREMAARGIRVRTDSLAGLAEEAGGAYKDVELVVDAAERAGISRRVARLVPIGNVKG